MEKPEAFAETEAGLSQAADAVMAHLLPSALHITYPTAFGRLLSSWSTGYGPRVVAGWQTDTTLIQSTL